MDAGTGCHLIVLLERCPGVRVEQVQEIDADIGSCATNVEDFTNPKVNLTDAVRIFRLEIRWPKGQMETVTGVTANQVVTITEGKGVTRRDGKAGLKNKTRHTM